MKKTILIPAITLVLCAAVLFGLSAGLKDVRQKNDADTLLRQQQTLLPGSTTFNQEEYTGDDATIRAVYKAENGYVIDTATQGYAGQISMLVGVDNDGKVTGLVVTSMTETPGLGFNALTDYEFLIQFLNKDESVTIGTDADAITGATVTSKAVARCVNAAIGYVTGADTESGATSWGG